MGRLIILIALLPLPAAAQWFAEVGIGHQISGCLRDGTTWSYDAARQPVVKVDDRCSHSPLGLASIGYQWRGFTVRWEHWSSLTTRDKGTDIISVRYRWEM